MIWHHCKAEAQGSFLRQDVLQIRGDSKGPRGQPNLLLGNHWALQSTLQQSTATTVFFRTYTLKYPFKCFGENRPDAFSHCKTNSSAWCCSVQIDPIQKLKMKWAALKDTSEELWLRRSPEWCWLMTPRMPFPEAIMKYVLGMEALSTAWKHLNSSPAPTDLPAWGVYLKQLCKALLPGSLLKKNKHSLPFHPPPL